MEIDYDKCIMCGICCIECPYEAVFWGSSGPVLDGSKCKLCKECQKFCPEGAIA